MYFHSICNQRLIFYHICMKFGRMQILFENFQMRLLPPHLSGIFWEGSSELHFFSGYLQKTIKKRNSFRQTGQRQALLKIIWWSQKTVQCEFVGPVGFFHTNSLFPSLWVAWQEWGRYNTGTFLTHTQVFLETNCTDAVKLLCLSGLWLHQMIV